MSKILLITDAWHPQTNGVVTTLSNLVRMAKIHGDRVYVFHPRRCRIRIPLPMYPEIEIAIPNPLKVRKLLKKQKWDHIHIATPEGPLGLSFISLCKRLSLPFSTSCHTKFPEFIHSRYPYIPIEWGWKFMRYVYSQSEVILTTTPSMVQELKTRGFTQKIVPWTRGVDTDIFYPDTNYKDQNIILCVSRVSQEKGLDDFCSLNIPAAQKILVGDGPYLTELQEKYDDVVFTGKRQGEELAEFYRKASVFVFPSKADTFGVVNIESLACGTPVAAYPVTGPIDIIQPGVNGFLSDSLEEAVYQCLRINRDTVFESSKKWTWEECYRQFRYILLNAK